jgi:hypothetical protein
MVVKVSISSQPGVMPQPSIKMTPCLEKVILELAADTSVAEALEEFGEK